MRKKNYKSWVIFLSVFLFLILILIIFSLNFGYDFLKKINDKITGKTISQTLITSSDTRLIVGGTLNVKELCFEGGRCIKSAGEMKGEDIGTKKVNENSKNIQDFLKGGMKEIEDQEIKIIAYLKEDVSEVEYEQFIERINKYYQEQNINVKFKVIKVLKLKDGEECGSSISKENADFINCVGPGYGGYMGPPYYVVGLNTNPPYGFNTDVGLYAEAHEFGHFLGFQDLYWLKTSKDSGYNAPVIPWLENELMNNPYDSRPIIHEQVARVMNKNIEQISSGKEIIGVNKRVRVVNKLKIITPKKEDICEVYIRERDYDSFSSKIMSQKEIRKVTDEQQSFEMDLIGINNVDSNFDLYYLDCSSGKYWISSLLLEDFYFMNNKGETATIFCEKSDDFCVIKAEERKEEDSSNCIVEKPELTLSGNIAETFIKGNEKCDEKEITINLKEDISMWFDRDESILKKKFAKIGGEIKIEERFDFIELGRDNPEEIEGEYYVSIECLDCGILDKESLKFTYIKSGKTDEKTENCENNIGIGTGGTCTQVCSDNGFSSCKIADATLFEYYSCDYEFKWWNLGGTCFCCV